MDVGKIDGIVAWAGPGREGPRQGRPAGHTTHKISDYIRSNLGKAVVLDHHVNRPGYVARDFGAALDTFFSRNPTVSHDPGTWAAQHSSYESSILDIYGNSRVMTDAGARYRSLKAKL